VTLVAESIAPLPHLQAYAAPMEWTFPWVSSLDSDFKYDFGAAFTDEQQKNGGVYNFRPEGEVAPQREGMSASPLGRNEDPENTGAWWHRHDEYETQEATRQ
jgi:predicted dithiol-disulfide oxidoreductase (DUF899 family)